MREVKNVAYLRSIVVLAFLAFFVFRSTLEYDMLQLVGTRPLSMRPLTFTHQSNLDIKKPRPTSYLPVSFDPRLNTAVQSNNAADVSTLATDNSNTHNYFVQNQTFKMNKIFELEPVDVVSRLGLADSRNSQIQPNDFTIPESQSSRRTKFFVKPVYSVGLQTDFDLYEMADLKVFEPGTDMNSFDAVQMESYGKRINSLSQVGFNAGIQLKNNISIASGLEMMEFSGTQSFIYDVEQHVTGTITRYVPIGGPPGSGPEFMEIEEQRVEKHDIQDTVTARFTYTALFIPLEIGYSKELNSGFEVFAAANTTFQVRARNEVNYESKRLALQRESSTEVYSGGLFMSLGLSAGVGYHVLPNLTLRAEPAITTFRNFGSDQNSVVKGNSRFTSIRTSLVWKW